jgi:hypothetical protein
MKTVIEMARIAGARDDGNRFEFELRDLEFLVALVRADERERIYFQNSSDFVKAAIADEREACAKVCDDLPAPDYVSPDDVTVWDVATLDCADAIRARSNT